MQITGSTQRMDAPAARTTKPATGTGRPKAEQDKAAAAARVSEQRKMEERRMADEAKKVKTVNVTA